MPSALVTCDAEARLAVVDLGSFGVVRHIRDAARTRVRSSSSARRAVVCHTAVGAVSIVDRHGVRHVLRGFDEPRYTAAHPDGRHAFVTDSGRSGVVAVDVERGTAASAASRCPAGRATSRSTGRRSAVGRPRLGVAARRGRRRRRGSVTSRRSTPGFGAHDVGIAPDGRLWVTAGERAASSRSRRACTPPIPRPQHVTFGAGRAYVTSGDAGELRVQTLDGRVLRVDADPGRLVQRPARLRDA